MAAAVAAPIQWDALSDELKLGWGMSNGRLVVTPAASVVSYISPSNKYVLVEQPAGRMFVPSNQMAHMIDNGTDSGDAAFMAGTRAGLINAVKALNWVIAGNPVPSVMGHIAKGSELIEGAPVAAAHGLPALVWNEPADQAALDAILTAIAAEHRTEVMRFDQWVNGSGFQLSVRVDETTIVPADYQLSVGAQAAISDGDIRNIYKEATQFALNAAALISFHLTRADGHYWMTRRNLNVAVNFYVKIRAASKVSVADARMMRSLHDSLHHIANLRPIFHTIMSIPAMRTLFSDAVLYRYPYVVPGTAIIGSTRAGLDVVREMGGLRSQEPHYTGIITAVHNGLQLVEQDLKANTDNWRQTNAVMRAQRDLKLQGARRLGALVSGLLEGWNVAEDSTVRQSPSLTGAGNAFAALREAGKTLGAAARGRPQVATVNADVLGITSAIAAMNTPWVAAAPAAVAAAGGAAGAAAGAAGGIA